MITKSLLVTAAVALVGLAAATPTANAGLEISIGFGQPYVSGRADCGCPIHSQRVCRGFDRYHRPIFATHRLPFHCGCHHKKHPPGKAYGHYKHPKHDKHYKHGKSKHYKHSKKHGKKCK